MQFRPGALADQPQQVPGDTVVRTEAEDFLKIADGEIGLLVVSKVANFSIDLPEASVAIQVSGTFGSRQEEAQRLEEVCQFILL